MPEPTDRGFIRQQSMKSNGRRVLDDGWLLLTRALRTGLMEDITHFLKNGKIKDNGRYPAEKKQEELVADMEWAMNFMGITFDDVGRSHPVEVQRPQINGECGFPVHKPAAKVCD